MPLDVLGCTRATLMHSTSPPWPTGLGNLLKLHRDGDRLLQLLIFNEEFLVSACHQRALITSLPFVHTARRSYRLNDPVRPPDCGNAAGSPAAMPREAVQTLSFRGRRSRNKVSVGEPAEGSFAQNVWTPSFIFESRAEDAPITSFSLRLLDADIWISELWSKISFRGRCLGSSSDEERSEMRFTTWTAKFRELLDLWTHAAIWRNPDCSFPSVYLSSVSHCSVHGVLGSTFSVWLDKN